MNKRIFTPLLSFLLLLTTSLSLIAAPADPTPAKVKQPDGTEITIRLKGDEKVHWMETLDGYSLLYDSKKYIVYAKTNENGDMVPSEIKVKPDEPSLRSANEIESQGIRKGLRYSKSQVQSFLEIWNMTTQARSIKAPSAKTAKAICALISYSDKPITKTLNEFSQLMNQAGYSANNAKGSVQDFYKENSYGQLELVVTVVGPYTVSKGWTYYGKNRNDNGNDQHVDELAKEAANLVFSDPSVKPADYDNDNDGFIDTFHFFYAGYGEEAQAGSDCVWAHKSNYSPALTFGTKKLDTYSCSPELRGNSGSTITSIGVVCHELCHVFGAPDYYDTNGDESGGDYIGTGAWDLMAQGSWNDSGNTPAHINMYQKIAFGWVNPTNLTTETTITNMKNAAFNPVAYTYQTTTPGEYFILENRQKTGFDSGLPGHGLLIYHVSSLASGNNVNNNGHPQQVYPVCASSAFPIPTGEPVSYGRINTGGCPFPGIYGKTSFSDYTIPASVAWSGNNTSKSISGITENNELISFKFMAYKPPVTNLKTSVSRQNVTISWDKPNGEVTGYAIYRNDVLLLTVSDASLKNYTQYNVNPGTYNYCVSAIYGELESAKACATAVVSGIPNNCSPIKNLKATERGNTIKLDWSPAFAGGWITQCGLLSNSIVGYNAKDYATVSYWPMEDLASMYGFTLTKVKVYIHTTTDCEYSILVWNPLETDSELGTPIINQKLNPTKVGIQEFTLTTPLKLSDRNRELFIGLNYKQTTPGAVVARDDGPKKQDRNYVYTGNKLYYTEDDFNFYLEGLLEDKDNQPRSEMATFRSSDQNTNSKRQSGRSFETACFKEEISNLRAEMAGASGYKVFRDGTLLQSVSSPTFTDANVPLGSHIYCISAIYDGCESEQTCIQATSEKPLNPYPPVTGLTASVDKNKVYLNWMAPEQQKQMNYSSDQYGSSVGNNSNSIDFDIAARWTPNDLKSVYGYKLTKIKFLATDAQCTYSIRVWTGGNSAAPETLVVDQVVTQLKKGGWNEVILQTPIIINPYEELWIGVRCNTELGRSAALDNASAIVGKGNMIFSNGIWKPVNEIGPDFTGNWLLSGLIEPTAGAPTAYSAYRNGGYIYWSTNTHYMDMPETTGNYIYSVSARYDNNESDKSEINVTITALGIHQVLQSNKVNAFPSPIGRGEVLTVDLGEEGTNADLLFYNSSGQLVMQEKVSDRISSRNIHLDAGIYLLQVKKGQQVNTLKIIIK